MRIFFLTLMLFILGFAGTSFAQANQQAIAIIVNEDAITMADLQARMDMVIVSSNLADNVEVRTKLAPQVINSLVEEQLKLQEAARLGIEISPQEIKSGFNAIAQQNNMPPEQFQQMLSKSGIDLTTMEHQISAQIAWSRVIQQELRPKIKISEKDINAALDRYEANIGKAEYLVAEIFLPVEKPKEESNIKELAYKLVSEIQSGKAPFFKVAQQFSKAAGAMNGGDLGWVQQDQLPKAVEDMVQSLAKGELSNPIRSLNGYHIVLLRDTRQISPDNKPSRDDITSFIGRQRLERLQQRHYMDIKSAAYIESRV